MYYSVFYRRNEIIFLPNPHVPVYTIIGNMRIVRKIIVPLLLAVFASVYIYPVFTGLILLPLDLLVSHSNPWLYANTILLKNAYMQDSISQMFPWKHLTFTTLLSGTIPLWNPYQFMGIPFMASMKPLVFYPSNIFFFLGEQHAWNIHLWLQLFLSLWFSYLFMQSVGAKRLTGMLAAIAFAFSSLMIGVLEFGSEGHVLLWLPLLLFFVKRYIDTKKVAYIVGLAFGSAAALFAGQLQYFGYMCFIVVVFSWFESRKTAATWKIMGTTLFGILLGAGIAAIQLIPGIELFYHSYRGLGGGYSTFTNGLLKPYSFLRLISPDWFGHPLTNDLRGGYIESSGYFGLLPLFFALFSLLYWKKPYIRFFACMGLFAALFSMNGFAQLFAVLHIPIITSGYGGRLFSVTLFSGAVLSAFGLQEFINEKANRKRLISVGIFAVVVGLCIALGILGNRWNAPYRLSLNNVKLQLMILSAFLVLAGGYVVVLRKWKYAALIFCLGVIGLTYLDVFRMGYRFLTFSNAKFLYPELPVVSFVRSYTESSLGRVYGITEPEIQSVFRVASPETYNPLYPIRTARLMQALEDKPTGAQLPENKYYLAQNERMKYVMDFLGVSVLVPGKGRNAALEYWHSAALQNDLKKIYEDGQSDVYENTSVYPRFGLFYSVKTGVSDDEALSIIRGRSVDFRKTVLIREPISWNETEGIGSVTLVKNGMNSLTFQTETDRPAVFYISDAYFPGWHVSVNDKETALLHANYDFRGVVVPTGFATVKFWYLPMSVIAGAVISFLSLCGAVVLIIRKR